MVKTAGVYAIKKLQSVSCFFLIVVKKSHFLTKGFKRSAVGFYYAPGDVYNYYWVQIFAD